MNLSESAKYVLKHKSQALLSGFWKEDVRTIFWDLGKEFKNFKKKSTTKSAFNFKDNTFDSIHIFSELPHRLRGGLNNFRDEFIKELDNFDDPKDKTMFSLKVIGALTSYAVSTMYEIRKSGADIRIPGLKKKNNLTQFMVTELVIRLSYLFILRFIGEIEQHIVDKDDLRKLRFFKHMLTADASDINASKLKPDPEDRAFQIVDSFKIFLMTGKES